MKRFKTMTGLNNVYELTEKNYAMVTRRHMPYMVIGDDGVVRRFAVCPACDNPIQIIEQRQIQPYVVSLYGKHIKKDLPVAVYNDRAYQFCPYASSSAKVSKSSKKKGMTAYEENILDAIKEYYDLAVYVLRQDTGIHISQKMALNMLQRYIDQKGYMYDWGTLYNIPWMVLYYAGPIPCYGMIVKKESKIWRYLSHRKNVVLRKSHIDGYDIVGNEKKYLDLHLEFRDHKRAVVDDEVRETIDLVLYSENKGGRKNTEYKTTLDINEYRFPKLIEAAKYRNYDMLKSANTVIHA